MSIHTSLLVCGKFHFFSYLDALAQEGGLRQFIFSHRIGAEKRFAGVTEARNLWLKEYLYQAHYRLLGERGLGLGSRFYHDVCWDMAARRIVKPCDLLHFLMHGNCRRTVARAKAQGAVIMAEAVNGHPDDYDRTILEELDRLGISAAGRKQSNGAVWAAERELADVILAPSGFVRRSYEAHGVPAGKIITLPYGANLGDFHPAPGPRGPFKVVCLAQVTARKGHVYLLEAWKKLALPGAELHCYGYVDRDVVAALRRMDAPNTFFHGSVPKPEVVRALQSADAFVLPTIDDGFGVVILEAMATGVPVITTENSGGPEVIDEGVEGFVVPIRRADCLAEKLLYLYENPDARRTMGEAARRKAEAGRDWRTYAQSLHAIYEDCVKVRRGGPPADAPKSLN